MKITSDFLAHKVEEFYAFNYPKEPTFIIINDLDFDYLIDELMLKTNIEFDKQSKEVKRFMGIKVIVTKDIEQGELILN